MLGVKHGESTELIQDLNNKIKKEKRQTDLEPIQEPGDGEMFIFFLMLFFTAAELTVSQYECTKCRFPIYT